MICKTVNRLFVISWTQTGFKIARGPIVIVTSDFLQACATNLSVTWKLPKGVTATPVSDGSLKRPLADGEHRVVFYEITGDVRTPPGGSTLRSAHTRRVAAQHSTKSGKFSIICTVLCCCTRCEHPPSLATVVSIFQTSSRKRDVMHMRSVWTGCNTDHTSTTSRLLDALQQMETTVAKEGVHTQH